MLFVITLAAFLFLFVWVAMRVIIFNWIEKDYNSAESKELRYNDYIEDLQTYVDKNEISSQNTSSIYNWMKENRNVYLFLYKDGQLFFDGSMDFDYGESFDKDEETDGENNKEDDSSNDSNGSDNKDDEDNKSNEDNENNEDSESGDSADEGTENDAEKPEIGENDENAGADADNEDSSGDASVSEDNKNDSDSSSNNNESGSGSTGSTSGGTSGVGGAVSGITGGITINRPTREEILGNAEKSGLLPIEFSDGTLLVSIVDSTDYLYYNMASIASLVGGVLVFVVVLMFYFTRVTRKITRLAKDVQAVYESDMSIGIRTDRGNDEFAVLTRNVEQMRSSMLESLEKEKEALEANSELITAMSHDIRTPLTVLLGYIDVMKEAPDGSDIGEYLHASEVTALRLKELSDNMFKYFLVSGKGIETDVSVYDARTLAEQLISEHVLLLMEKNYNVTNENKINQGTLIKTDAQMLMRVVDNAFSNIYKYADKEKQVNIISEDIKGGVAISFENHISAKDTRSESNNVGLRSCEKLCESMGAKLVYGEKKLRGDRIFTLKIEIPAEEK